MSNVNCYGAETRLIDCLHNTETSGQNASMICGASGKNCTE